MKAIILAAGEGTRLRPHTLDRPKCMVPFRGRPIIDYILDALAPHVNEVHVVTGYKGDVLEAHLAGRGITFHKNEAFATTNMVSSLFCAERALDDDAIISYSDIVYGVAVVAKLAAEPAGFSTIVDRKWWDLWKLRMADPLSDAETMKLDAAGNIRELGKKATSRDDIEGQYIGLLKVRKDAWPKVRALYHGLDKAGTFDGKPFDKMFMTSFVQSVIDHLMPVKAVLIDGGWCEIDSVDDLAAYERHGLVVP